MLLHDKRVFKPPHLAITETHLPTLIDLSQSIQPSGLAEFMCMLLCSGDLSIIMSYMFSTVILLLLLCFYCYWQYHHYYCYHLLLWCFDDRWQRLQFGTFFFCLVKWAVILWDNWLALQCGTPHTVWRHSTSFTQTFLSMSGNTAQL